MNFFTKKNFLFKLIVSICIILALTNVTISLKVYAAKETGVGGALISPICDLLLGLGDAIMNIIQKSIMGTDAILVVDNTKEINWGELFATILIIAAVVALSIVTAGGFTAFLAAITPALIKTALVVGVIMVATGGQALTVASTIAGELLQEKVVLPEYTIGPEEIFSGRILLFDTNIFNPKEVTVKYKDINSGSTGTMSLESWNDTNNPNLQGMEYYYYEGSQKIATSTNNSAYELRDIISKWYYIIRTIALVGSMLILLYVGIRIIISSIAEEKAKYKQMLADWVIAICLIFLMHYIMVFAHNIAEGVTNIFSNTLEDKSQVAIISEPSDKLIKGIKEIGKEQGDEMKYLESDESAIYWPTNQMGRFRVEAQAKDGNIKYIGFAIAYVVLVLYTLIFSVTYIKRLLYLLFLTVISPLVALTYPIDKMHDGKAQAFDMWLKEYIFNLLIQPFHLLLYTIFATMAFELASTNVIYSLVVMGFMIPAEKFLRTMFGFNKASTPGMLGGAAGAAVAMSAMKSLGNFAKGGKGGKGGKDSGGKGESKEDKGKLRTADSSHSQSNLFADVAEEGEDRELPNSFDSSEKTTQQRMLDAYDENNYGTDEYDSAEREAMARDAYQPEARRNSSDEFRQILEDSGYEGEDLEEEMRKAGYGGQDDSEPQEELLKPEADEPQAELPKPEGEETIERNKKKAKNKNGKSFGRVAGKVLKKSAISAGKFTLRTGANLALGTTGAMLGLAAGIASGDPSKAFQNATIGAGVGASVSSGVINRAQTALRKGKGTIQELEKDYYGSEYNDHMRQKADEEFKKDKATREMYKQQLNLSSKKEVDEAMDAANQYRAYGINDNNVIIKAMKADNGHKQNWTDKRRIAAAKLAENSRSEKDLQTHMKRFAKTPGITEKQVEDMERRVRQINNL